MCTNIRSLLAIASPFNAIFSSVYELKVALGPSTVQSINYRLSVHISYMLLVSYRTRSYMQLDV